MEGIIKMEKENCAVLDLDGVIFNSEYLLTEIYNLGLTGNDIWEYFYKNCNSNKTHVLDTAWDLLQTLYDANLKIIFSTARNEKCREETNKKLWNVHGISYEKLYMRLDGDLRPSQEIKKEHLKEIMKNYNIVLFIDDDLSNCRMARDLGILALGKV